MSVEAIPHVSPFEAATQQALLRLASQNLGRSVPLLLLACAFIGYLGWRVDDPVSASIVCVLGLLIAFWRLRLRRLYASEKPMDEAHVRRAARRLELQAALSGLMWMVATGAIYPDLPGMDKTFYAVFTCGSVGVAAFFMPLVGRSFLILTVSQMGSLVVASLFVSGSQSLPLAFMGTVFGFTMYAGGTTFCQMTRRSIRRGLEVEAANDALREAVKAAATANEAKSVFLANMSHEIRTPLTAVIGFSEGLLDIDLTMDQRIDAAQTIQRAGKHLLHVINGILDLSKVEAERLDVEHTNVPLVPLVEEVAALAGLQASGKGLRFSIEHVFPIPKTLCTDPLRVRQILLNLVGNAIKFTDTGAVTVRTSYAPSERQLTISVIDSGIGISDQQLAGLFQPFGQADASISRRFGGSGLGLVLSRNLAHLLGGTIDVTSAHGQGSCFNLRLPITEESVLLTGPAEVDHLPALVESRHRDAPVSGDVLLAEDNPDNQRLIGQHLRRLGAAVEVVDNGALAVEAASARPRRLVLMDMQMPVMDGLSAVRILRAKGYRGPIVALTANATRDDMQASLDAGCDAFLTKPIERDLFDEVVRRFLPALGLAEPAPLVSVFGPGATPGSPELAARLRQLHERLLSFLAQVHAAAKDANLTAIRRLACDLKSTGSETCCAQAIALAGRLEFTATARDPVAVRQLIGRFEVLIDRVGCELGQSQAASPVDMPADDGPIISELIAEGPQMADLVTYFLTKLPDYLANMQLAVRESDIGRIGRHAHDLKSVGGGYGFPVLFDLAVEFESATSALDQGRLDALATRYSLLVQRILASAQALPESAIPVRPPAPQLRAELKSEASVALV